MTTFADPLKRANQISPAKIALIDGDTEISYATLWNRCTSLAQGLRSLGLRSGDRVAILAAEFAPLHRDVRRVYLPAVSSSCRSIRVTPIPKCATRWQDSGAKVLLTDRDPAPFADLVEHVISLPDGYEALLASATRIAARRRRHRERPRRPVLYRRHDRRVERRDAQPSQSDRQHVPLAAHRAAIATPIARW